MMFHCWGGGEEPEQFSPITWQPDIYPTISDAWVRQAASTRMCDHIVLPGQRSGQPDAYGVCATSQLNTRCVSAEFFPAAAGSGIILYEPFGGICAGLEMCLRNGLKIVRYYYSDVDALAQRVALHRSN